MAAKTQITNKGLELMASSSKATGQHWWLGWYALAYVPDEMQEEKDEKLSPSMTKLTKDGDIIYNIFQGDMNGDGYQTTKASAKFKSVNYDSNIKKNYRYVLDDDGRNNLVTFVDGKHGLKGAYIYKGVQVVPSRDDNEIGHENSTIPLPAPLLYTGVKAAGEGWNDDSIAVFLGSGNESIEKFYPVEEVMVDGEKRNVPRVSTDFRNYEGYKNGLPLIDSDDAYEFGLDTITQEKVDFDGWFPSVNTYTQNDETDMGEDYNQYCYQYWKVLSISNFNKYCAPVNASGLLYDENTGCRNMAKATKYFPISDYSVTSTAKTENNEYATGIKLKVQLKLNGNAEDGSYFKDVETESTGNVATLNPEATEEEHALFNTQKVSFKFNRIGIYAVPMRQYGCSDDSGDMKAQYQIDTEAEPVLFAVCEWDSPVTLSDSGDGLSEFQSDIFIDLSAAVEDSSVIRESAVFYNLYEDDALDWYKNQLVANASMAEALVNMQIEMGYIRNQKNAKAGCCPKEEAIQQKEKSVTGLRNLVDAKDYNSNSVRNRLAQEEGVALSAEYSDIMPKFGGIGSTESWEPSANGVYARKSTSGSSTVYSAIHGASIPFIASYEDAVFDGNPYINMSPSIINDDINATKIGKLWVRRSLYYEIFSFIKPTNQSASVTYDYPDDVDSNEYFPIKGDVVDYFGSGTDGSSLPYVTITKKEDGTIETKDGDQTTPGFPTELNSVTEFVNEINRSFENYEVKRVYIANYYPGSSSRGYTGYRFKRTTTLKFPKIQLYKLSTDTFADINKRIEATGWRIPSLDDWNAIINEQTANSEKTQARIKEIRSSTQWGSLTGGTGDVCPIGGVLNSHGSTSLWVPETPKIWLAIADDPDWVIEFDGTSFKRVQKSVPEREGGFGYVSILCVADAIPVSNGTSNYKLGYDSYSLMLGSITQGNHNFNAGENSSIFETANYNIILGGLNNKINNAHHNVILHGYNNEIWGAVHSVVSGHGNILKSNTCRMLVSAYATTVSSGATSAIFAESCTVENAWQSSIFGASLDIKGTNLYCSRVTGQSSEVNNVICYSDVIVSSAHNLPQFNMSRGIVTSDYWSGVPSDLVYTTSKMEYSELFTNGAYYLKRKKQNDSTWMVYSRMCAGGSSVGIINTCVAYSDIFAYGDVYGTNGYGIDNSWFKSKTLDSVGIMYSTLKLQQSSVTSNYVRNDEDRTFGRGYLNFCDLTLSYTSIQMSDTSATHNFNFGVMKLSHSVLSQCDCSYVSLLGCEHSLISTQLHYATLLGNKISMSSNYIRNTHIYGSLHLPGSLDNHIILGGLDGTSVGSNSASSYISEFGAYIINNIHSYPMIWSLGGIGMFMNKMVLGNKGVSGVNDPHVGDVLTVVAVEGNVATVAWRPGGSVGNYGTFDLDLIFKYPNDSWGQSYAGDYAITPYSKLNGMTDCIYVNNTMITRGASEINEMNVRLTDDIKFTTENNVLKLVNNSSSDSYEVSGTAKCTIEQMTGINPPTSDGAAYGWQMWDTVDYTPVTFGTYEATLSTSTVAPSGKYSDLERALIFGIKKTESAQGSGSGDLCSIKVGPDQTLVCRWHVTITYRKV